MQSKEETEKEKNITFLCDGHVLLTYTKAALQKKRQKQMQKTSPIK